MLDQPALSQTEPCPDLGANITAASTFRLWGDWDCDGEISSRDNQALLRDVLSQAALSQTEPCPDIGIMVAVGVPPPATIDWANASIAAELDHGQVRYANDDTYLYLLLDMTGDTVDEPGDYFWLGFDVNENGEIDPNVDIEYGIIGAARDLCFSHFVGPGTTTGCSATPSSLVVEFGASSASATPHMMWEFALLLNEVQAAPGEEVRIGLRVNSGEPSFQDNVPADFDYSLEGTIVFTLDNP